MKEIMLSELKIGEQFKYYESNNIYVGKFRKLNNKNSGSMNCCWIFDPNWEEKVRLGYSLIREGHVCNFPQYTLVVPVEGRVIIKI